MPVVDDMESKLANALMMAMQRMGLASPTAAVQATPVQQPMGPPQMLVNTAMVLPRIDRSRQREVDIRRQQQRWCQ